MLLSISREDFWFKTWHFRRCFAKDYRKIFSRSTRISLKNFVLLRSSQTFLLNLEKSKFLWGQRHGNRNWKVLRSSHSHLHCLFCFIFLRLHFQFSNFVSLCLPLYRKIRERRLQHQLRQLLLLQWPQALRYACLRCSTAAPIEALKTLVYLPSLGLFSF